MSCSGMRAQSRVGAQPAATTCQLPPYDSPFPRAEATWPTTGRLSFAQDSGITPILEGVKQPALVTASLPLILQLIIETWLHSGLLLHPYRVSWNLCSPCSSVSMPGTCPSPTALWMEAMPISLPGYGKAEDKAFSQISLHLNYTATYMFPREIMLCSLYT